MSRSYSSSNSSSIAIIITIIIAIVVATPPSVVAYNNGVARTPPMGWLSWEYYACDTDCHANPDTCISARLYQRVADQLVAHGYRDVGYTFVNVDDCWSLKQRGAQNQLVPDESRFPGGIAALCKYLHQRGLQCGLYQDIGTETCGGYPGLNVSHSTQYIKDIALMASWGIDSLKVDGCNQNTNDYNVTYPKVSKALNATGRPIVYACSWPAYIQAQMTPSVYSELRQYCNLWRNYNDITDSWTSIKSIINWWQEQQGEMTRVAGPGNWNDPDMLMIGNTGLSLSEQRVQMALWCIWSAPLLMSNDLSLVSDDARAILQNKELIAVNQDRLGHQGYCVNCHPSASASASAPAPASASVSSVKKSPPPQQQVWVKVLDSTASHPHQHRLAVAFVNLHTGVPSFPNDISINVATLLQVVHRYHNDRMIDVVDVVDDAEITAATVHRRPRRLSRALLERPVVLSIRDLFTHRQIPVTKEMQDVITLSTPTNGVRMVVVVLE